MTVIDWLQNGANIAAIVATIGAGFSWWQAYGSHKARNEAHQHAKDAHTQAEAVKRMAEDVHTQAESVKRMADEVHEQTEAFLAQVESVKHIDRHLAPPLFKARWTQQRVVLEVGNVSGRVLTVTAVADSVPKSVKDNLVGARFNPGQTRRFLYKSPDKIEALVLEVNEVDEIISVPIVL